MVLAEALLRVPDAATADRLIEDKLAAGRLGSTAISNPTALLVSASAWTLGITARIIHPGETPETILDGDGQAARPAGGAHGDAPGDAAASARISCSARPSRKRWHAPRGHGRVLAIRSTCSAKARARADDAERYFDAYAGGHRGDRRQRRQRRPAGAAGHFGQAFGAASALRGGLARARARGVAAALLELARMAKAREPEFHHRRRGSRPARTVARRDRRCARAIRRSRGWDGFGLAVQAYQKRALAVIDWVEDAAARSAAGSRCGWSRAPIGTPRSSARRSAASPTIRCSPARR